MQQVFSMVPLLTLVACAGSTTAPQATSPTSSTATVTASQVENGKNLYIQYCAHCHGNAGQGSETAPAVVGSDAFPLAPRPGAKRDVQFLTAADVFAWTIKHMPGDAPGSLSTDQYLAIFAFDLTANGIKLDGPLDGAQAAKIVLHP